MVEGIIHGLMAALQHMAALFEGSNISGSLDEDPTAYCCCCISTMQCIQRRLLWLQHDWQPHCEVEQRQQQQGNVLAHAILHVSELHTCRMTAATSALGGFYARTFKCLMLAAITDRS